MSRLIGSELSVSVVPEAEKQKAVNFISDLLSHLAGKGMLFKGWQQQRDVRRKVKAEVRVLLLSKFKEHKGKNRQAD